MISNQEAVLDAARRAAGAGRSVIFDLDNTLYDEALYLALAYRGFADDMAKTRGVDADAAARFMIDGLRAGERSSLLQDFATAFGIPMEAAREALFRHLRERPLGQTLPLYEWSERFLAEAPDRSQLAIVTNGNPAQQANKIAHLPGLARFDRERIVFANLHAPKPSPAAAVALGQVMALRDPLYIGDTDSDAAFAEAAGFAFFRAEYCPD